MSWVPPSNQHATPPPIAPPPTDEPWSAAVYKPGRDRDLLVETLGKRYEVETTTDVETLDTDFDCCIFDYSQFNRVAGTVQSRRDTSEPVFLPFVLLIGEDTSDMATVDAREYVDDVIELPTEKADLLSRTGNLVERRRTAAELAERKRNSNGPFRTSN